MRRAHVIPAALAIATALGCEPRERCAFEAQGAPWVAFSAAAQGGWDLEVIRTDGSCRRPLTKDGAGNLHAAWGPGALVAYESSRAPGPGLWILDAASGAERRLDLGDLAGGSPAFSPDGTTIAFEGRAPGSANGSIYLIPAAGGSPRLLTSAGPGDAAPEPHGNGGPSFSADGASVYFVSNRSGAHEVYRIPAGGGDAVPLTAGSRIIGKPVVSPDGRSLVFARLAAGSSTELVLQDLESGTVTVLPGLNSAEPAFDPSGRRLAVRAYYGLTASIQLLGLDGQDPIRLTEGPGPDAAPAFAR